MTRVLVAVAALAAGLHAPAARADEIDDRLARQLSGVVRDPRLSVGQRVAAARTLGKLGPRAAAAVPDLVIVLERVRGAVSEPVQEAVVDALGQIGAPARGSLPTLARASARSFDMDQAIRRSTERILLASDDQDVDALTEQLGSRDPSVRLRAVKALGTLGPAARVAGPAVAGALGDPDPDVRRGAIVALRLMFPAARPTEAVVRAIAVDLADPDPGFRMLAARALGRLGTAAVVATPDLEALRNDPDPDVRRAVADALVRVGAAAP